MTAALLAMFALICFALGAAALRSVGPGFRVARLLSASPHVAIAEAIALAREAGPRYVRVSGRISSDEEFPDEHDRPLVYRRTRIEVQQRAGAWQTVAEESEAVPFGIETRGDFLAIDAAALGDGLVVVPREALGRVSDLEAGELVVELPAGLGADDPSRLVIEQISAVEHAHVAGVPVQRNEEVLMTAGLGRPLVMTTVELPEAMRLLARGQRRLVVAAAFLLAAGLGFSAATIVALVTVA